MKKIVIGLLFLCTTRISYSMPTPRLSVTSFNIRNYKKSATNNRYLINTIRNLKSDIIAVQEIVDYKNFYKLVQMALPQYKMILSKCGGRSKQKLGIIYNPAKIRPIQVIEHSSLSLDSGCNKGVRPGIAIKMQSITNNLEFIAIALHLKAGARENDIKRRYTQLKILHNILKKYRNLGSDQFIILGDLNTTEYNKKGPIYRRFMSFVEANELYDYSSWLKCTSYWNGGFGKHNYIPSLLDHIMVSKSLHREFNKFSMKAISHCLKNRCKPASFESLGESYKSVSDHCPIISRFY